ncbi:nitrite/sulfite reductase [Magnetovibrio sp. PR-2]|uniref:nitrite/sulfite reductase n=1 Tax=Magnetovibrio sp. PR-2 TaxID=3120356 RepID=UPI002FCDF3F9
MTHQRANTAQSTDWADFSEQTLSSVDDISEFRKGISSYIAGDWHDDRWKTFRLRFGIYEQRQAGEHMMRIKQPGGRLSFAQARTIARANAAHGGGDVHITTRQGIQLYFIALKNLTPLIEGLNLGGVSTREASGNTFRAVTACPKAGFCGAELTDAATAADQLARAWLRHPLTQHMPRKFKTTVSGCEQDCGLSTIDDLGFIATDRDSEQGFRVTVGGGLGTHPTKSIDVFDFVTEDALPAVQEAVARVHVAHSSRINKNKARTKFLVKRFGAEEFVRLVKEQFNAIRDFERRQWAELDWSQARDAGDLRLRGAIDQPNGGVAVGVEVPLGWLTSGQLEQLADLAEKAGADELRLTRDQNIVVVGLDKAAVEPFIDNVKNIGLDASGRKHAMDNLVSCPGTYTCAIGITDSHSLAESLLDAEPEFAGLPAVKLRISGCHNSCGHHHIADIGLHGVAKKISGKPAPHYQVHLGGTAEQHGILGPVFPAAHAKKAIRLLLEGYKVGRMDNETVRAWAERLGKEGIERLLAPVLTNLEAKAEQLRFDIGDDKIFVPPATATGECAAGAVVAEHLSDLARVARQDIVRAEQVGNREQALIHVDEALKLPAQRLLVISGGNEDQTLDALIAHIRDQWSHDEGLLSALNEAISAKDAAQQGKEPATASSTLRGWAKAVDHEVERILSAIPGFLAGAAQ